MSRDIEKLIPVIHKTIVEIIEEKITLGWIMWITGDDLLELKTKTINDLENKFRDLANKMCMNMLDSDLYRRKWNLIINGVEGIQGGNETTTRTKVKAIAKNDLKYQGWTLLTCLPATG